MTALIWHTAEDRWCPNCGEELLEITALVTASYAEHWWKQGGKWVLNTTSDHETEDFEAVCDNCHHTLAFTNESLNSLGLDHQPTQEEIDHAR